MNSLRNILKQWVYPSVIIGFSVVVSGMIILVLGEIFDVSLLSALIIIFFVTVVFPVLFGFLIFHFLILFLLKVLKISREQRYKIGAYLFATFLFWVFLVFVLAPILSRGNLYLINTLVSFWMAFLLLKYLLALSGKKLLLSLIYLLTLNFLIFSSFVIYFENV